MKSKKISYGMELVPQRALNKLTDKLKIYHHKYINGKDSYCICFCRKLDGELNKISIDLNYDKLQQYTLFIKNYLLQCKSNESIFNAGNSEIINIKSLDKSHVKLVCNTTNGLKVFFSLHRYELKSYLKILESILNHREHENYANTNLDFIAERILYPIKKCEKDKLYLNALYAFADGALDKKDKELFQVISKEINKYLKCYNREVIN
ncbi:MAG: hypothetical protein K0R54_344 [Clostridiaceae bacterium]|nr:hypothetical protein [Clostridiaceae bacterium]